MWTQLGVLFLILGLGVICIFIFGRKGPEAKATYLVTITAAVIGITFAFQLDRTQTYWAEKNAFKSILFAVGVESGVNHAVLRVTEQNIKKGIIKPFRFYTENVSSALGNPIFARKADTNFYILLSKYHRGMVFINRALDRHDSEFMRKGKVGDSAKDSILFVVSKQRQLLNKVQSIYDIYAKKLNIAAHTEPEIVEALKK